MFNIRFPENFKLVLAGPSNCGKSTHAFNLIRAKREIIHNGGEKSVVYCYGEDQPLFDQIKKEGGIVDLWINELPSREQIRELRDQFPDGYILIIDDLAFNLSKHIAWLFTIGARHNGASVILLTQNLFVNDDHYRTVLHNASHIALFKTMRTTQIEYFFRTISASKAKSLFGAYVDATRKPYSYFYCDFSPDCLDILRYKSHILPHEVPTVVYIPQEK